MTLSVYLCIYWSFYLIINLRFFFTLHITEALIEEFSLRFLQSAQLPQLLFKSYDTYLSFFFLTIRCYNLKTPKLFYSKLQAFSLQKLYRPFAWFVKNCHTAGWVSLRWQQLRGLPLLASASLAVIRRASYTMRGHQKVWTPSLMPKRGSLISRFVCVVFYFILLQIPTVYVFCVLGVHLPHGLV